MKEKQLTSMLTEADSVPTGDMRMTIQTGAPHTALGFYHKISHLRADTWNALTYDLAELLRSEREGRSRWLLKAIRVKLTRLEIIQAYHAFPTKEDFRYIWALFDQAQYVQLEKVVRRIPIPCTTIPCTAWFPFLKPPFHRSRYEQTFGMLYTAAYHPADRVAKCRWPKTPTLRQSFAGFRAGRQTIKLSNLRSKACRLGRFG